MLRQGPGWTRTQRYPEKAPGGTERDKEEETQNGALGQISFPVNEYPDDSHMELHDDMKNCINSSTRRTQYRVVLYLPNGKQCTLILSPHSDTSIHACLRVCTICNISNTPSTDSNTKDRIVWKIICLKKCIKTARYLTLPNNDHTDLIIFKNPYQVTWAMSLDQSGFKF